jgi:hypothetical protein
MSTGERVGFGLTWFARVMAVLAVMGGDVSGEAGSVCRVARGRGVDDWR